MMKKIFAIICLLPALFFAACNENVNDGFDSEGAVYFQLNTSQWSNTRDSVNYSFVGNPEQSAILKLRVMLMGDALARERTVKIAVNRNLTTAVEGTHYEALGQLYALPANAFYIDISVTLFNTQDLKDASRTITVELEPTSDLSLGIAGRTHARIVFSNMLFKPSRWDNSFSFYFGKWSRVKHEKCVEIIGMTFDDDVEYIYNYLYNGGKYMSRWFEENYPIYDENGDVIEPWM